MGTLTIRNVDDDVIAALKARAKSRHRSLEGELRLILERHADPNQSLAVVRERLRTAYGVSALPAFVERAGGAPGGEAQDLPEGVSWLGCMADLGEIVGDIVAPAASSEDWEALRLPDVEKGVGDSPDKRRSDDAGGEE